MSIIESPTVTDRVRALLLHRNRIRRELKTTFNPYDTKNLREEVRDLYEACKETGDQPLIDSVAVLSRLIDRQHGLNVKEYQEQGYISRGGQNFDNKPLPKEFFYHAGDRTLCNSMAQYDEEEFLKIIKEAVKSGDNSHTYLIHRLRPLTDSEREEIAQIEQMYERGMTRKEIVSELELGTDRASRLISYVPKEKRKEARRRAVSKTSTKGSVHAVNIANRSIELMQEGLALMDLIDLDKFNSRARGAVNRQLKDVIKDIKVLIGEEEEDDV